MGDRSTVEWTDATWNPVTGCTKVSPGCDHCYAERITRRWGGDFSKVVLHPERLALHGPPWSWRKPRRVFVCSVSDLFHHAVDFHFIFKQWGGPRPGGPALLDGREWREMPDESR